MHNFFITDFETGGLDSEKNPITEIAISVIDYKSLKKIDHYQSYIKPYGSLTITKEALEASNVSMKEIEGGKDYRKVMMDVIELAKKHKKGRDKPILVGHNFSSFDQKFMKYWFNLLNKNMFDFFDDEIIDTLREIKRAEGHKSESLKNTLTAVCERYGISLKSAHGAEADVEANEEIFKVITNKMRDNVNSGTGRLAVNDSEGIDFKTERTKARKFFEM